VCEALAAVSDDAPALPFETILHPTDFSEASQLAFAHALRIATLAKAELSILHATTGGGSPHWHDYPGVRRTLERWGLLPPDSPPEAVGRLGLQVEKVEASGMRPLQAILRYLEDFPARLIVLATEGREGLPRWLERSVAELVARSARAPTLFVPHGARGFVAPEDGRSSLRRILVPVDRVPRPGRAIAVATALARGLGAGETEFVLFHVGEESAMPALDPPRGPGWSWRREARRGNVVETLLAAAREAPADLVVMATQGHEGFLDALRGSTTEQLLRRAECPLLAVPESAES
jgi:nucleotide-binding universal stress UspA family protein